MLCYPFPQQTFQQHVNIVPAPVGINGIFMPPRQEININFGSRYQIAIPPPPPPPAPPKEKDKTLPPKKDEADKKCGDKKKDQKPPKKPEAKKDAKKEEPKKKETKKESPKKNRFAPPPLLPGTNYMFPTEHTQLHIFQRAAKVWEDKYKGVELKVKIFKVDTQSSVKSVIERTLGVTDAEKCKGWAISEVLERGDGQWAKGSTIEYASDKAKGTLASMGWNARRGDALPPVWVVVHKA
ncbi:hypothetical protein LTR08_000658 [Meristemomyces frigidus]|nr:hypothetical protein LTR08_000658 [Meristemomyces frigidus]